MLFLIGHNISQLNLVDTVRAILISLVINLLIFIVCKRIYKNKIVGGYLSLLLFLFLFSYGHFFNLLYPVRVLGLKLARNSILLPAYLLFLILGLVFIRKSRSQLIRFTPYANVLTGIMLMLPIIQTASYLVNREFFSRHDRPEAQEAGKLLSPVNGKTPDIYFIVLDGYNRDDILLDHFSFDNSSFIKDLQNLGFYVIECSMSNYDHTNVSLASELNLNYMQALIPEAESGEYESKVISLLDNNLVRMELEKIGYRVYQIHNDTYPWLNWSDINSISPAERKAILTGSLNPFEVMFLDTTIIKTMTMHFPQLINIEKEIEISRFDAKMAHELFILDTLPELASKPGPKFVNAHLMITHTPFIFTSNGERIDPKYRAVPLSDDLYRDGYINQVEYLNKRLLIILGELVEKSKDPPIIILQADHGNKNDIGNKVDRPNQIFTAYFLPGLNETPYPTMSSINTFRFLFNHYFDTKFSYLEDNSYQIIDLTNYTYELVEEDQPRCK